MLRKQRTTILVKGDDTIAQSFAEEILKKYHVVTLQEPHNALIMAKMRESAQKKIFYLGEVCVTECRVMVEEVTGLGLAQGDQPQLAFHLAVIDAAFNVNLPECKRWQAILTAEESKILARESVERARVSRTRVKFETMDEV
jgi:alpha-D-ribose 1-methylphosphonate 5-triphosphate synthase subunit PhnG